jgi:hypothetical protein
VSRLASANGTQMTNTFSSYSICSHGGCNLVLDHDIFSICNLDTVSSLYLRAKTRNDYCSKLEVPRSTDSKVPILILEMLGLRKTQLRCFAYLPSDLLDLTFTSPVVW